MSRFVRQSKYRHVFGKEANRDGSYDQIKVTRSAWDTNNVDAGTKFWACIWEAGGGGAFVVSTYEDTGKRTPNPPLVAGHKAAVLDIAFSNFNPYIVASASEDCMVKIWAIPEEGLTETLTEEAQLCKGHRRKVGGLAWHPTANNVLVSTSTDYLIKFWDVEVGEAKLDVKGHKNIIQTFSFNWNGSLGITSSKDKSLRLVDGRADEAIVQEWHGHDGVKGMRSFWIGEEEHLVGSVGFSRSSDRQLHLWDTRKTEKPIFKKNIDTSSGMLMPFYDNDTKMLYLGGKGDGNIRYYEIEPGSDEVAYYLSEYKSSDPQKGLASCPKRMLNVPECEVARFLKVTAKNQVIPISMTVPRKSDLFQDDIFPDTYAGVPTQEAADFFAGKNSEPKLMSMEPEEGAIKQSEAPVVKTEFKKKEVEKELEGQELKDAYEALKKKVAYLEAEILKKDLRIEELSK